MKKQLLYTEAMNQLEKLVTEIESGEYTMDELAEKVKQATQLVAICKQKLQKIDTELTQILGSIE